ncbi:MAG: hypothetical protein RLZZ488_1352 [Pseudomonadota bacterium]|jgi:ABC-type Fe3+-hydroxamate transport system substrate-binding protein
MKTESRFRIVSLVPSITETLCHFGLIEQIVGCTSFCVEPKTLRHAVPSVGGTKDARIADIIALRPTHVVVNLEENTAQLIETLRNLQAAHQFLLIETFIDKPEDNFALIELLASAFSLGAETDKWIADQQSAFQKLKSSRSVGSSFSFAYFIWMNPWMVAGNTTYISSVLSLIGGVNSIQTSREPNERYPEVKADDARLSVSDVLLFSSEPFPFKLRHMQQFQSEAKILRPMLKVDGQALSWYGSRFSETLTYLEKLDAEIQKASH